jgi:transcriptional regulator with XRE-family HTH domain
MNSQYRELANRLRTLREARGLTQVEVAKLTGLAQTSISSYESGRRVPRLDAARALAQTYGVSLQDFSEWPIEVKDRAADDRSLAPVRKLLGRWDELSAEDQLTLGRVIDKYLSDCRLESGGHSTQAEED